MNREKTSQIHNCCMVKLLLLTLCALLSDSGYADDHSLEFSPYDSDLNGGAANIKRFNIRQWLFEETVQQSLILSEEIRCLALNIYFEARSESIEGQHAVGHVVLNRVAHSGFPDTICGVVKQGGEKRRNRCQFSWWCDGRSDEPLNRRAWLLSLTMAYAIYHGHTSDPTQGALWYHADYVTPHWSKALMLVTKIGHHLFYLSRKEQTYALNLSAPL